MAANAQLLFTLLLGLANGAAAQDYATCTPWPDGARPCPAGSGDCAATWDNAEARWSGDATCLPAGTMSTMSSNQGSPPTCGADADCASGYACMPHRGSSSGEVPRRVHD